MFPDLAAPTDWPGPTFVRHLPSRHRADRRHHVHLLPLVPPSGGAPAGYLTEFGPDDDVDAELANLRWTLQALAVLDPDAFLTAAVSAQAMSDPRVEEITRDGPAFMPILEAARMGRRRQELEAAVADLSRLGIPAAVGGSRIRSAEGFAAMVVTPAQAPVELELHGGQLIVTGVETERDLAWAVDAGANLVGGPAVAEPVRMAPVDLSRLRR